MKSVQHKKTKVKTKNKVRRLYSKPVLILLVIILILLANGTWGVLQKERESRGNVAMAGNELTALDERKAMLERETNRLNTEEGIEGAIREKFQVSKSDENVLIVVDKPLPVVENEDDKTFFSKVWDSVTHIFDRGEREPVEE